MLFDIVFQLPDTSMDVVLKFSLKATIDGLVKSLLLRHSRLRGNDGKLAKCSFYDAITINKLVKSEFEVLGWLWKKADILGVVFEPGSQLYIWYVEILVQTHNDVDRTFYDAITINNIT